MESYGVAGSEEDAIHISAETVDEGACALITFLMWVYGGRPGRTKFIEVLREQCSSTETSIKGIHHHILGLLHPQHTFTMWVALISGFLISNKPLQWRRCWERTRAWCCAQSISDADHQSRLFCWSLWLSDIAATWFNGSHSWTYCRHFSVSLFLMQRRPLTLTYHFCLGFWNRHTWSLSKLGRVSTQGLHCILVPLHQFFKSC
jgi:hypothetical protein